MLRRRFLTSLSVVGLGPFFPVHARALEAGEPSRTAQGTALHRAVHQLVDSPRVFDDPLALAMLGARRAQWLAGNLDRFETPGERAMRAYLVARSRYAEDRLAAAHARGVTQYLVLGAGLDTFAYRNPYGERLRVFEVDHPATQSWKRTHLLKIGILSPRSLTFVPVDFEKDSLAARMSEAGFDRHAPVFISWLGVTMYLTEPSVMKTLRLVARWCAPGSEIVFDFALPDESLDEGERTLRAKRATRVADLGEPWLSTFHSEALSADLAAVGFTEVRSVGATEANEWYFSGRSDTLRFPGSGRLMTARG